MSTSASSVGGTDSRTWGSAPFGAPQPLAVWQRVRYAAAGAYSRGLDTYGQAPAANLTELARAPCEAGAQPRSLPHASSSHLRLPGDRRHGDLALVHELMRDTYHYISRDLDHTDAGTGWVEVTLLDRYWMQLWAQLEHTEPNHPAGPAAHPA